MKRESRTVARSAQVESPAQRHLPLVDLLVDVRVELMELAVRSGLHSDCRHVRISVVTPGPCDPAGIVSSKRFHPALEVEANCLRRNRLSATSCWRDRRPAATHQNASATSRRATRKILMKAAVRHPISIAHPGSLVGMAGNAMSCRLDGVFCGAHPQNVVEHPFAEWIDRLAQPAD
jgi:hypothetical protein